MKSELAGVGRVCVRVTRPDGSVLRREGKNICTSTGKEMIIQQLARLTHTPTRMRSDTIAYIGLGSGAQPAVPEITSLISPLPYVPGQFLAPLLLPVATTLGGSLLQSALTFRRTFLRGEISMGETVYVSEAGLFSDGDPRNSWVVPGPTDMTTAGGFAPAFYRSFEPVPVSPGDVFDIAWEVRIV